MTFMKIKSYLKNIKLMIYKNLLEKLQSCNEKTNKTIFNVLNKNIYDYTTRDTSLNLIFLFYL